MIPITIIADLTQTPFKLREGEHPANAETVYGNTEVELGRMPRGTSSGKSSVMIKARGKNGELIIIESTMALLCAAVDSVRMIDEAGGQN